jgi:hypothetical protein
MQMGVHVRVQELLFSVFSQSRRMNQWRSKKGQKPEEAVKVAGSLQSQVVPARRGCVVQSFGTDVRFRSGTSLR